MFSRRLLGAGGAVALALVLASCAWSSEPMSDYTPLTKSTFARAVSEASSSFTSVHTHASVNGGAFVVDADFDYRGEGAAQMSVTSPNNTGAPAVLRLIGTDTYLQIPAQASKDGTVKWAKLPPNTTDEQTGYSPKDLAEQYKSQAVSVDYLGPSTVDGQTLYKYAVVLPLTAEQTSLVVLRGAATEGEKLTVTEHIYLNDKNVLQRIVIPGSQPLDPMETDFSKWNAPLSITAPSEKDLVNSGQGQ